MREEIVQLLTNITTEFSNLNITASPRSIGFLRNSMKAKYYAVLTQLDIDVFDTSIVELLMGLIGNSFEAMLAKGVQPVNINWNAHYDDVAGWLIPGDIIQALEKLGDLLDENSFDFERMTILCAAAIAAPAYTQDIEDSQVSTEDVEIAAPSAPPSIDNPFHANTAFIFGNN